MQSDVLYTPGGLAGCATEGDDDCERLFDGQLVRGSHTLDIYAPPTPGPPARPVIVWVHGGFGISGDKTDLGGSDYPANLLARQLNRGYVVVSLNYRLNVIANGPNGVRAESMIEPIGAEDLDVAVRFLKSRAAQLELDPDRILLWGHSWGGYLAQLAATAPGRYTPAWLDPTLEEHSPSVAGVVAEAGPGDLIGTLPVAFADLERNGELGRIDMTGLDDDRLRADSPITHVDATDTKIYAMSGTTDPVVPTADNLSMARRYAGVGRRSHYLLDQVDLAGGTALPASFTGHLPHPGANRPELEDFLDSARLA